jgi:TM2 domain-containing membrane protein YozV
MKKILLIAALVGGFAASTFAKDTYKLNDASVDQMFAQSSDITLTVSTEEATASSMNTEAVSLSLAPSQTKIGYYLRLFFCGMVGLHRSYMGTGGKTIWFYYCIPGLNGAMLFCDFWITIFKSDLWDKYKNNSALFPAFQ